MSIAWSPMKVWRAHYYRGRVRAPIWFYQIKTRSDFFWLSIILPILVSFRSDYALKPSPCNTKI